EVLDEVESEIGRDDRVDGVGDGALQQGVAVVRRVRHEIGGDVAASAAAVLDDELLPEALAERLREHARGDIARRAGGKADDDAHRPRRVALRLGDPRDGRERGRAGCELEKSTPRKCHGVRSLKLMGDDAVHSALNVGSGVGKNSYGGTPQTRLPAAATPGKSFSDVSHRGE